MINESNPNETWSFGDVRISIYEREDNWYISETPAFGDPIHVYCFDNEDEAKDKYKELIREYQS